jgi:hypothetical protein
MTGGRIDMKTKRIRPWWILGILLLAVLLTVQAACAEAKKENKKPATYTDVWTEDLIPIPEPKEEIMTPEPGEDYVWIPGNWERSPDTWQWVTGHWEKPPHKKAHWVNGSWQWEEGKWHWMPGHWMVSYMDQGLFTTEPIAAPALIQETPPPRPTDKDHWVPGYWEWDGTWFWMPGYWTTKSDVDAKWVLPAWTKAGSLGYKWTAGHWVVK